jgi:hydroxysqualene dehydroxylase
MNIVVGGGWAGIAAAVELAQRGLPVTLVETAGRLGGRARTIAYRGRTLDNGQHLLIGACRDVRHLQSLLGLAEAGLFERRPLELRMLSRGRPALRLRLPALPAPLHLIAGLVFASGLAAGDRLRALRLCLALRRPAVTPDCSVRELLARHRQTPRLIASLWQPLCLATLNTPIDIASARIFVRVLHDAFARRRDDSHLLLPRVPLGGLLPDHAQGFIEARGGRVLLKQRVCALDIAENQVHGVELADGVRLPARQVILALPPAATARLFAPHAAMRAFAAALARLETAPICTVTLEYPPSTALPFPMIGLEGVTAQWVFDHALAGHPGRMSVVISGPGAHMHVDSAALLAQVAGELSCFFPHWPAPRDGFVVREKQATIVSHVGIDEYRPSIRTPLANCLLAGDAVATGYPSTLEGAVRSGLACARALSHPTCLRP